MNVRIGGSPATATITWSNPIGAGGVFSVQRWLESNLDCCFTQVNGIHSLSWIDQGVQWPGTYIYRVISIHPDNSVGITDARWVRPDPVNPANFRGSNSQGTVTLRWDAVPGASWYELSGPNIPFGTLQVVDHTVFLVRDLPPGTHSWRIGSIYSVPSGSAAVSSPRSAFPVVTVIVPD